MTLLIEEKSALVSLAQSVEHLTFNQVVMGSNPVGYISRLYI